MQILSYLDFFPLTSSFQSKISIENPQVQKILDLLNRCPLFKDLLNELESKNIKATVIPLTSSECEKMNVIRSTLNYEAGWWPLKSPKFEILYDASMPFEKQVQSVLMEYCNLTTSEESIEANNKVIAGKMQKSAYIFNKEEIEYKGFKRFVVIAQSIESLKLVPFKSLVTEDELKQAHSLANYLSVVMNSGHAERYGRTWASLRPQ